MNDEAGTGKIPKEDLKGPQQEEGDLTGEELETLADLFASALLDDQEKEEDTGSFEPVSSDDTGPLKPVID